MIICKFYIPSHCLFVGGDKERLCVSKTQNDRLIESTVPLKFVDSAFLVFVARVFHLPVLSTILNNIIEPESTRNQDEHC